MSITGLILAGGRSSRMGDKDKGLVLLKGKPMLEYVKDILIKQVDDLLISANQNQQQYENINNIVLTDEYNDYRGPLAGIYEGLKHIKKNDYLLVVPCDGPLFPNDLCQRLLETLQQKNALLATVFDGQYRQPTYSLIHCSLKDNLKLFLEQGGRKLGQWLSENNAQAVDFSDQASAFININSQVDLDRLEQHLNTEHI
jgi:molybdopterin-guanine dinucleotide biosynthesis protein A